MAHSLSSSANGKTSSQDVPVVVDLTDSTFFSTIKSEELLLTDFWAPWCGPCRMMSPMIDEFAKEYANKIRFARVNVDSNPVISQQFGIMSIPTFIVTNRGKVVDVLIGAMPKEAFKEKLDAYLTNGS